MNDVTTRWKLLERALGMAVAAVVLLRVVLISTGWPEQGIVTDDAYYYYTIAHNVAAGLGPTFDTLTPTNGFHPLWLGMLTPLFAIDFADAWVPVRLSLILALVLDVLCGLLIWNGLRSTVGREATLFGVALWFLSPLAFALGVQGMEGSIHALCFASLWRFLISPNFSAPDRVWRSYVIAGALIGLTGWARSDAPALVGPAFCVALLIAPATRFGSITDRVRRLAVSAVVAAAVMLPWWIWNQVQFGSPVSTAGRLKFRNPKIWGALPGDWDTIPDALYSVSYVLFAPMMESVNVVTQSTIHGLRIHVWFALPLLIGMIWLLALGARAWRKGGGGYGIGAVFLTIYVLLHVVFYGSIWRSYGTWYATPVVLGVTILLATSLNEVLQSGAARAVRGAVGASALLAMIGIVLWVAMFARVEGAPHSNDAPWRRAFDELGVRAPRAHLVLGAWDAGVAGYVALDYPYLSVTNLDGLVNNQVQRAVETGTYLEYLVETVDVYLQDRGRARMYLSREDVERLRSHGR